LRWFYYFDSTIAKDYFFGTVLKIPPYLFQPLVVVDGGKTFEINHLYLFGLAVVRLDIVAEILSDISIGEPNYFIAFLVYHEPLLSWDPNFSPPILLAYPLFPKKFFLYAWFEVPPFFRNIYFCFVYLLFFELRVEGSQC
jgi:hypothetical protein